MKPPPGETPREPLSPEDEYVIKCLLSVLKLVLVALFGVAVLSAVMEWVK